MASDKCFCGSREPMLAAVRKNARLLRNLTDTLEPELAGRLLESARAADASFDCHPSG